MISCHHHDTDTNDSYTFVIVSWCYTMDDSGVGQGQLNGTASKTTLQLSEYDTNEHVTSL